MTGVITGRMIAIADAWRAAGYPDARSIEALDDDTRERIALDEIDGRLSDDKRYREEAPEYLPPPGVTMFVADLTPEAAHAPACKSASNRILLRRAYSPGAEVGKASSATPEKSGSAARKKSDLGKPNKAGTYKIVPVRLYVVVLPHEIRELLEDHDQDDWTSRTKVSGLMSLLDYVIRKDSPQGVAISLDLAEDYTTSISRPSSPDTIRGPLAVLKKIGILEQVQAAERGFRNNAAKYTIAKAFALRKSKAPISIELTLCVAQKRIDAPARKERRLNLRHKFRSTLIETLQVTGISPAGKRLGIELVEVAGKKAKAARRVMAALTGEKARWIGVAPSGQIGTIWNSCPKELKPHIQIGGEDTVSCDIGSCHPCMLPCLSNDRVGFLREKKGHADCSLRHLLAERDLLASDLSNGDFYTRWMTGNRTPANRDARKNLFLVLLNSPNEKARANRLYRRFKRRYPQTFSIMENLKQNSHKRLAHFLQHVTAQIMTKALLRCQAAGIPAIPDTDAIICPVRYKPQVCAILGEEVYRLSGVACRVGGIQYVPGPVPC